MTLRQFVALQERFIDSERRQDRRCARIVAHIVNMAGKSTKQLVKEEDFMPGFEKPEPKRQTPDEMRSILAGLSWVKPIG